MWVQFWGVRGDIAVPGSGTVRYGGHTLCATVSDRQNTLCILDAGSGLTALGGQWRPEAFGSGREHALFLISHNHWSHTQGIGFFAPFFAQRNRFTFFGLGRNELAFYDILEAQLAPSLSPLQTLNHLVANLSFKEPNGETFSWDALTIHPHPIRTGIPGYRPLAYRLSHAGRSLVYLPRAEYPQGRLPADVLALCRGADLLIHGGYCTSDDYRPGMGHSPASLAVDLAQEAGVARLVLTCYNPAYDDDAIDRMIQECHAAARGPSLDIAGAREGLALTF